MYAIYRGRLALHPLGLSPLSHRRRIKDDGWWTVTQHSRIRPCSRWVHLTFLSAFPFHRHAFSAGNTAAMLCEGWSGASSFLVKSLSLRSCTAATLAQVLKHFVSCTISRVSLQRLITSVDATETNICMLKFILVFVIDHQIFCISATPFPNVGRDVIAK